MHAPRTAHLASRHEARRIGCRLPRGTDVKTAWRVINSKWPGARHSGDPSRAGGSRNPPACREEDGCRTPVMPGATHGAASPRRIERPPQVLPARVPTERHGGTLRGMCRSTSPSTAGHYRVEAVTIVPMLRPATRGWAGDVTRLVPTRPSAAPVKRWRNRAQRGDWRGQARTTDRNHRRGGNLYLEQRVLGRRLARFC